MCFSCCSALWRWLVGGSGDQQPQRPPPPAPPRQQHGDEDDDDDERAARQRLLGGAAADSDRGGGAAAAASREYAAPALVLADGAARGGGDGSGSVSSSKLDASAASKPAAAAAAAAGAVETVALAAAAAAAPLVDLDGSPRPAGGQKQQQEQQQEQQLEGDSAPIVPRSDAPPPARLSRGGLNAVSAAAGDAAPRRVLVMRHGHRQDEADATWTRVAARPWDPPLSSKGRVQARDAAPALRAAGVEVIVTSPVRRCLQTSAEVAAALGLARGRWFVDWGLSEVSEQRSIGGVVLLFREREWRNRTAALLTP